ncbi:MAG TPA: hypothetical protein VJU84_01770 [Pyrinomonadaceae bacterium]|nr:hypothetical protein [Pyrinomonadaceae bacterium]
MKAVPRRARLLVAPYVALTADAALTLLMQSQDYWSGRYEAASEAEVIGEMTLRLHPLAFVAWIVVWASILALVIALVPPILARITSVAATLLHTFALLTWLLASSSNPYVVYLCGLLCAALIVYSLEQKTETGQRPLPQ